jgi:hypothetical protein
MTGTLTWTPSIDAIAQDVFVGRYGQAPEYVNVQLTMAQGTLDISFVEGEPFEIYIMSYSVGGAQRVRSASLTGVATLPPVTQIHPATNLAITFKP